MTEEVLVFQYDTEQTVDDKQLYVFMTLGLRSTMRICIETFAALQIEIVVLLTTAVANLNNNNETEVRRLAGQHGFLE